MSDDSLLRDEIASVCQSISEVEDAAGDLARKRQDALTKPQGSLGRLEELSVRLAEMKGTLTPSLQHKCVFTLAGDHGVVAEGVAVYPQSVSVQMVANFLSGGAAINCVARQVGARVVVADIGLAGPVPGDISDLRCLRVADGTANFAHGPAMARGQMWQAVDAGVNLVADEEARGLDIAALGEMGIGNTTPATAILAALTGDDPAALAGPGTGLDEAGVAHKADVVRRALETNQPDPRDGWDVLHKVGGFETAGLVGVILACSDRRIPCVLDGFISTSAGLIASRVCPKTRRYMLAGHRSAERGHDRMLELLELRPILDLAMRLGEGTGAALALPILEAAVKVLGEMATFAEASVNGKQ